MARPSSLSSSLSLSFVLAFVLAAGLFCVASGQRFGNRWDRSPPQGNWELHTPWLVGRGNFADARSRSWFQERSRRHAFGDMLEVNEARQSPRTYGRRGSRSARESGMEEESGDAMAFGDLIPEDIREEIRYHLKQSPEGLPEDVRRDILERLGHLTPKEVRDSIKARLRSLPEHVKEELRADLETILRTESGDRAVYGPLRIELRKILENRMPADLTVGELLHQLEVAEIDGAILKDMRARLEVAKVPMEESVRNVLATNEYLPMGAIGEIAGLNQNLKHVMSVRELAHEIRSDGTIPEEARHAILKALVHDAADGVENSNDDAKESIGDSAIGDGTRENTMEVLRSRMGSMRRDRRRNFSRFTERRWEMLDRFLSRSVQRRLDGNLPDEARSQAMARIESRLQTLREEYPVLSLPTWRRVRQEMRDEVQDAVDDVTETFELVNQREIVTSQEILAAFYERLDELRIPVDQAHAIVNNIDEQIQWMIDGGAEREEVVFTLVQKVQQSLTVLEEGDATAETDAGLVDDDALVADDEASAGIPESGEGFMGLNEVVNDAVEAGKDTPPEM